MTMDASPRENPLDHTDKIFARRRLRLPQAADRAKHILNSDVPHWPQVQGSYFLQVENLMPTSSGVYMLPPVALRCDVPVCCLSEIQNRTLDLLRCENVLPINSSSSQGRCLLARLLQRYVMHTSQAHLSAHPIAHDNQHPVSGPGRCNVEVQICTVAVTARLQILLRHEFHGEFVSSLLLPFQFPIIARNQQLLVANIIDLARVFKACNPNNDHIFCCRKHEQARATTRKENRRASDGRNGILVRSMR